LIEMRVLSSRKLSESIKISYTKILWYTLHRFFVRDIQEYKPWTTTSVRIGRSRCNFPQTPRRCQIGTKRCDVPPQCSNIHVSIFSDDEFSLVSFTRHAGRSRRSFFHFIANRFL